MEQVKKLGIYYVAMFFVVTLLDERCVSRAFGMSGKHAQEVEDSDISIRFSDVKGVSEEFNYKI